MNGPLPLLVNAAWPSPQPDAAPATLAERVSAAGADGIGLPDSPRLFPDPLIGTERLLASTGVTLAGPCVLALGLRHAAAAGAALRALGETYGPRSLAVLARGESAVRNEGLAPMTGPHYRAAMSTVAEVSRAGDYGATLLGAASGPRTLQDTATRLGGVLIDVGVNADLVANAVTRARQSDPDVRCWLFIRAIVTDDPVGATETLIGSCAARMVAAPQWYQVPDAELDGLRAIAAAHDYRAHGRGVADGSEWQAASFVRDRFFLCGKGDSVSVGIARLAALGIDGVILAGATAGLLPRLAATVRALRTGLTTTLTEEPKR